MPLNDSLHRIEIAPDTFRGAVARGADRARAGRWNCPWPSVTFLFLDETPPCSCCGDSRLPAGAHAHSAAARRQAVKTGAVHDLGLLSARLPRGAPAHRGLWSTAGTDRRRLPQRRPLPHAARPDDLGGAGRRGRRAHRLSRPARGQPAAGQASWLRVARRVWPSRRCWRSCALSPYRPPSPTVALGAVAHAA
ncbi:hypothetical protein [Nonomuraea dietziae]|uniref:hypothetical protein n=1 Tax=Nonomuraea dietziae TaxID=65515 RepID=UPI0031D69ADC